MKRFCLLYLIAVLFCCFRAAADAPVPVLCLASEDAATQGLTDLDPKAVAAYREQGFELHFGYYQKVTRDELMRYPVVVGMIPQLHAGTRAITPELAREFDEYMRAGGGLVLIPGPSYYTIDDFVRQVDPFLKPYGVGLCNEIPVDSNPDNTLTQVRALAYRYLKTTALDREHPVTRDIPFLYLPLDFSYNYMRTYTMTKPSPEWTVLVTGEETCGSAPHRSLAAGKPEAGTWKSKPPFLAVRPVGKGFLALFTTASRYFLYDAYHWAFGDGFVLNEGNGMKLMTQLFRFVSQHRADLPAGTPPVAAKPEEPRTRGNLPVIQDRNEWRKLVLDRLTPPGFGVRYYCDAGGLADGAFTAKRGCGVLPEPDRSWVVRRPWMDIFHPTAASARACDLRSFRYRFDRLAPNGEYRLGLLLWSTQKEGARDLDLGWTDADGNVHPLQTLPLPRYDREQGPRFETVAVPREAVSPSGTLTLDFSRGAGGDGSFSLLAELWLFEKGAAQPTAAELAARYDTPAFGIALQPEVRVWRNALFGAQPGRETVAELAAAARKSNLDLLVAVEEFDKLTPETLSRLAGECRDASDGQLQVQPGVRLTAAEAGPARRDRPQRNTPITAYFTGPLEKLPDAALLGNPYELFWKFFGGECSGGVRSVGNLPIPAEPGTLSPYFQRFWRGLDLDGGDRLKLYGELTAAGYGPQPRLSAVYRTGDEIREGAKSARVTFPTPPGEKPWPFLYASCVSTGPEFQLVSFSSDLTRDGEPGNGDIFREALWCAASLDVESKAKITDAILTDGVRELRHFRPNRTRFAVSEPVRVDRQTSLYWIVRAEDGTFAVTGSYSFVDERMRGNMCADNQNSICSVSRAPEKFVRDERELYLQHSYWHTGQAQGQLGVMRDARQLVPRVIESGIVQPCKYVRPMPRLELADGGAEDHTDSKMTIAAASGEGNRIRYEFQVPGGILSSRADLTAFRPSADGGDTAVLVELAVRAERDLAATEIASLELFSFGLMPPFPANWRYRVETAPGQFADGMLSGTKVPVTLPLAPFGAAALYPNNLAEPVLLSLNAEPLEVRLDTVNFWNCRERLTVLLPKSGWKKGEERKFSFVMQLTQTPVDTAPALAELKRERLERGATVTAVKQGTQNGSRFVLDFDADANAAAWSHAGWTGKDPLPLRIKGLNPNWSALLFTGKTAHALPLDNDGTALFALPSGDAAEIVAGNPATADDPGLAIDFAGISERGVSLRLHNPGDKAKTFLVRSNPAFETVIPPFSFRLALNPGAGMWVTAKGDKLFIDNIK